MGMEIEPFSIREWEWELIPIFWQRMGMGINSSFLVNGPKSALSVNKNHHLTPLLSSVV